MTEPSRFVPAWWCRGAHMQTLWPVFVRRRPTVVLQRERLELPDGDFLDLDWTRGSPGDPIVLILHGLEGSSDSQYARGLLQAIVRRGWRGVVMHFRGCSGEPNRLPRSYHSGETADVGHVLKILRQRESDTPIAAVGYSLGGNVLLKYLGESGRDTPLRAAAAVSVPMLLNECALRLEIGFSRVYQWHLVRSMRRSAEAKRRHVSLPIKVDDLAQLHTFREWDDAITAPLHGFAGVEDYYAKSSSRQFLAGIAIPTLLIHAKDDPFMRERVIPTPQELAPAVTFELYDSGGHVGFVAGSWPWRARYWLEERIPAFCSQQFE